jgi:tRNA threonylcarbamoyl adenosine modification protein (Sua5/YciO/YrdC/YwlC family)
MAPPDLLEIIAEELRSGGVVVLPTDTVYGLVADPFSAEAMRRLFELKGRPDGVPIAVLVGSRSQAEGLVESTTSFTELATTHWPGALTLVAPTTAEGLHIGATNSTLGVRLPDHALIRGVTARFGPIAATSANLHGQPTIVDAEEARRVFGSSVDLIIDEGTLDGVASTVVDVTSSTPAILRQGDVEI